MDTDSLQMNFKHERQYIESFITIWLDMEIKSKDYQTRTIEQLQIISTKLQIFDDPDACIDFITNLHNDRVLLIVSKVVDLCILTLVQDLPVVSALYIWSSSNDAIEDKWSQSIRKIKGVYMDMNELIKQIQFDLRRFEHDLIGFEILEKLDLSIPTSRNVNKQEYQFMYTQLLKDVFSRFQDNSTSELVEYCRTVCAENPHQLSVIKEFERDYQANTAIWWYTRDTFLYKLLNRALHMQHVETLYNMRTFIRHLHQQLIQLCPIGDHTQSGSVLTLYRGQKMSIREFEKLKNNEGGLLSVSNFLSTTESRELAFVYAGQSDDTTIAIVFQLTVHLNHHTNSSFACIEQFSHFGEVEHEWLFSMGTVFRMKKIELLKDIWYIYLTLTNDQDETLEKLTIHMSKIIQIQRPNPLVPLCRLFTRMGEYKKAVELCEKHAVSENDWEMKATLYDTLALMQADKDDSNLALEYHEQALKTVLEHVDANDPLAASYHNNVAISCSGVEQNKRAIEHYQIAINLELNARQPDYTNIAYSYESMGNILYYSFEKYKEAMNCYERALELMLAHLPSTHLDIISLYDSIAEIYEVQNELDKALNMLYKCVDIMEKNLESNTHDLLVTYKHIAEVYQKQKKFEEASAMLNKCRELEVTYHPPEDFDLENVDINGVLARIFRAADNS